MTTTDLTTYAPATEQGVTINRPDLHQWAQNLADAHKIGSALCTTTFAPAHFRGKADEAAAAILYGSEVGFTPTQALQNLYVIGGKPALYARPMVAIVQAAGHEVWTVEKTDETVTVAGRRRGSEHVIEETWTLARAQRAGYTTNKKYQTDPQAMLYARAASDVCRQIAADALAGMAYSVEELEMTREDGPPPAVRPRGMDAVRAAALGSAEAPAAIEAAPAPESTPETGEAITDPQRRAMFAAFAGAGFASDARSETGRKARLGYIGQVIGREVESTNDLTTAEASRVIEALNADAAERNNGEEMGA